MRSSPVPQARCPLPDSYLLFQLLSLKKLLEPLKRIELSTSSLPRKCSTPELQRLIGHNCHAARHDPTAQPRRSRPQLANLFLAHSLLPLEAPPESNWKNSRRSIGRLTFAKNPAQPPSVNRQTRKKPDTSHLTGKMRSGR